MRLAQLSETVKQLRQQLSAMGTQVAELEKQVADAAQKRDPLASLVYSARQDFRRAIENSGKSGKRIEMTLRSKYIEAANLGFKGTIQEWRHLLGAGA